MSNQRKAEHEWTEADRFDSALLPRGMAVCAAWARMNWIVGLPAALLLTVATCHAVGSAPDALLKKLGTLAGPSSQDCGAVPLSANRAAAIACANDAAASGKAYRVAVQLQGTDAIWQGAARDERGRLWVVFFEPDPSGGPAGGPTLSVLACREIVFPEHRDDDLECKPFTGEP